MAVAAAVPAEAMGGRHSFGDDQLPAGPEAPDRGPAQDQIAEVTRLLRGTLGRVLLDGCILSALSAGLALEAVFSPSVPRRAQARLPRLLPGPLSSVPP